MDDRPKRPRRRPPSPRPDSGEPQAKPFLVRLDPQSKPGEFNFVVDTEGTLEGRVPHAGLVAEASGGIPPQLYRAVDEVLGFIYRLDQPSEGRPKRPGT
ncbi:MAG TPA: hypothetical protein V6D47_02080 [Oscillatoriaceae cyanobacterium]